MKSKGLQPRLLYPQRLSVKMEGEISSFSDKKKKAERIHFHQTSIISHVKGTALRIGRKRVRERERERNTGTKEVKWQ